MILEGGTLGSRGGFEPPTDLLIRSREGSVAGSILGKEDASYMLETLEEFEDEESEDGTGSGLGNVDKEASLYNHDNKGETGTIQLRKSEKSIVR